MLCASTVKKLSRDHCQSWVLECRIRVEVGVRTVGLKSGRRARHGESVIGVLTKSANCAPTALPSLSSPRSPVQPAHIAAASKGGSVPWIQVPGVDKPDAVQIDRLH